MDTRLLLPLIGLVMCGASSAQETEFQVSSDPGVRYFVLQVDTKGPLQVITTKRIGKSGTSFAKREVDCKAQTIRYLAEGDSLSDLAKGTPDKSRTPYQPGTIAASVAHEACWRAPLNLKKK
jgi:hypothetical protein